MKTFIVIVALLAFAFADFEVLQGRLGAPRFWKRLVRTEQLDDKQISFSLKLRLCNLDVLETKFWEVSNPKSKNYGKYWSLEEIDRVTQCPGDIDVVKNFLLAHGINKFEIKSSSIKVTCTVREAERLFQTTFYEFRHQNTGKVFIRQEGRVLVPPKINEIVEFVTGIDDFIHDTKFTPIRHNQKNSRFVNNKAKINPANDEYNPNAIMISDPYVTPSMLHIKYGIPFDESVIFESNKIGIAAFDNDYSDDGLCRFQGLFNDYQDPPVMIYNGPPEGSDQVESDLDVQYSTAIANGAIEYFDNHPPGEWVYEWTQNALEFVDDGVFVWSVSYGWPEIWQCVAVENQTITNCPAGYTSEQYVDAVNAEFQKLGVAGVTIFVSSGDDGTPGFAANCPLDYNLPYAAAQLNCSTIFEDGVCHCGELTITYTDNGVSSTCFLPNGFLYPSGCFDIPQEGLEVCGAAYTKFVGQTFYDSQGKTCNMSSDSGLTGNTPYFYSNCTCDTFTPISVTVGTATCSIQGYIYESTNGPAFLPDFPTSSPFVTSVGATAIQFSSECSSRVLIELPEIYCEAKDASGFSGGGGFSTYNHMPSYQEDFVNQYLSTASDLPPDSTYISGNRGYPDIALNGHNYVVAIGYTAFFEGINPANLNGEISAISGTSASSPATAAIFTLINDYLIARDLPTLGFLNPLLYEIAANRPEAFTDILPQTLLNSTYVAGAFSGCTQNYCCQYGFEVAEGWDPATGLGTPNYLEILDYVLEMHGVSKSKKN